jgi:hypothetical protein
MRSGPREPATRQATVHTARMSLALVEVTRANVEAVCRLCVAEHVSPATGRMHGDEALARMDLR